jgi:hypothetical protein
VSPRRRQWKSPRPKDIARRGFGFATVVAVALATVLGGHRYFYCRPMARIMVPTHCPCARAQSVDRHATGRPAAAVGLLNDCFELRVLDRLDSSTVRADFAVPAAGLIARLPAPSVLLAQSCVFALGADQPIRAGPYSPTALRAKLMVFLT